VIRFLPFAIFILFFILESLFVELFPVRFLTNGHILVPRFLLAGILLLTIYGTKKQGLWYGLLFGLTFDIVYTEVIGIYLFMFPLTAYFVSKLMKILQTNIIISTLVVLLGIAVLEVLVYEMNYLIHITGMPFPQFVNLRLLPTLIINFIFLIIFVYPLKKQFEKISEQIA
jgi:rod shape-determining protein MreD